MNLKKEEVKFMGHVITANGLKPDLAKVSAIQEMPRPTCKKELMTLLGFISYLSKFLPRLSDVVKPLRDLTAKDAQFLWSHQHDKAFQEVKELVVQHPVLKYYNIEEEVTLQCDGIGRERVMSSKYNRSIATINGPDKYDTLQASFTTLFNEINRLIEKGELSNSAKYFSTFANVNKEDKNNINGTFCLEGGDSCTWKPWAYTHRIQKAVTDSPMLQSEKEDALYTCQEAISGIRAWKAHQLRLVNQDKARIDAIDELCDEDALIIQDWAMKFLPRQYRESQGDWFAKRGFSWHISVVIRKRCNEIESQAFVHIVEQCNQDSSCVVALMEHVLRTIKEENPDINSVFYRMDNAGCYHSANTIRACEVISKMSGITIKRLDFSDPQGGKGPCDRFAATLKNHVRAYSNEGHDVASTQQFVEALQSHGGVPSARISLLHNPHCTKLNVKWPDFRMFNSEGVFSVGIFRPVKPRRKHTKSVCKSTDNHGSDDLVMKDGIVAEADNHQIASDFDKACGDDVCDDNVYVDESDDSDDDSTRDVEDCVDVDSDNEEGLSGEDDDDDADGDGDDEDNYNDEGAGNNSDDHSGGDRINPREEKSKLFVCPNEGCVRAFQRYKSMINHVTYALIVPHLATEIRLIRQFKVEIPQTKEESFRKFMQDVSGRILQEEENTEHSDNEEAFGMESPEELAKLLKAWLSKKRVSVAFVASKVVGRSQGTLSSLLNKPPSTFPARTGREPWKKINELMNSRETQDDLVAEYRESNNPKEDAGPPKAKNSRKLFQKHELASLDAVYPTSRYPSNGMVDTLSKSLGLDTQQEIDPGENLEYVIDRIAQMHFFKTSVNMDAIFENYGRVLIGPLFYPQKEGQSKSRFVSRHRTRNSRNMPRVTKPRKRPATSISVPAVLRRSQRSQESSSAIQVPDVNQPDPPSQGLPTTAPGLSAEVIQQLTTAVSQAVVQTGPLSALYTPCPPARPLVEAPFQPTVRQPALVPSVAAGGVDATVQGSVASALNSLTASSKPLSAHAMATYGKIDEYQETEDWGIYVERLNHYFEANDIKSEDKQKSIFLATVGAKTYKLIRNLFTPDQPKDKSYEDLTKRLQEFYKPQPSVIVQRFRFNTHTQENGPRLSRACRSKGDASKTQPHKPQGTHRMQGEVGNSDEEDAGPYTFYTVRSSRSPPYQVNIELNGKDLQMELDTGASLSIINAKTYETLWGGEDRSPLQNTNMVLQTYTGEKINPKGIIEVSVAYGKQNVKLPLHVVEGKGPALLGRDWLEKIQLDWPTIKTISQDVVNSYPQLFEEGLGTLKGKKARIHVDPGTKPEFYRARPVPYTLREKIEQELERLQKEGTIEPVQYSDWATPIVPVVKSDGTIRLCGDYKLTVNKVSTLDAYPIPKIDDLYTKLAGGKTFTELDLSHAYEQMLLDDDSKQNVTINTHQGLYRYNRLPYGVSSTPGIFQRTMETLLQGIPCVGVFLDNILITGRTEEEHLRNINETLKRLSEAGLRLKTKKCNFMKASLECLGYRVDAEGFHPVEAKVKAVKDAPTPKNVSELKSFLGMINCYGKFLPNLASTLEPLHVLLRQNHTWKWGKGQEKAFQAAKDLLQSSRLLVHYDQTQELVLSCDASPYGVGAVLAQVMEVGSEKPVSYASRTLSTAEKNYSQLDKEALAVVFAVKKFHQFLYGRHFKIYTDHKPLLVLLSSDKAIPPMALGRVQRWALTLSAYEYDLVYRPGRSPMGITSHSPFARERRNAEGTTRKSSWDLKNEELSAKLCVVAETGRSFGKDSQRM
ncbi:hypothetical protein QZH41_001360 [Actinostola sp. cb2023]|nr:hypothetical protein QZH41_001360 [Actinostola sp. cb2023]